VVTDLSDQKKAEQALMESEAQLRSLFENSAIGMYRTTPEGRISMANPALIHMLGYKSFDELAKRDLSMGGYEPEYKRQEFRKLIEQDGEIHGLESTWRRWFYFCA
jgi:PAS domain S-box-containing protein